ncbi:undecaprenyl-diphosphatase [Labedaea rhizosphaerae]|uniref:Undecaprenyl-diphosphatase n=1 Tax=Labedaea rhizosphaerae TaxID=598644 RepID=A0A4R6SFA0_LABRH|nr:undecaprenyl-diphosphatase [Labedaea rhizosphaerae]
MIALAAIDDGWYSATIDFAQRTPWLQEPMVLYSDYGVVLFGALMVLAWRLANKGAPVTWKTVLWPPATVLVAYAVSNLVKIIVREPRPCLALHGVVTVAPCDFATDYSFPSNHEVIVAAAAVVIMILHRGLGVLAVLLAVVMGYSRVYVGAHYPHDVLAGFLLGAVVAGVLAVVVAKWPDGELLRSRPADQGSERAERGVPRIGR